MFDLRVVSSTYLTTSGKLLYTVLAQCAAANGVVKITKREMSHMTAISYRCVQEVIKDLFDCKLIERTQSGYKVLGGDFELLSRPKRH